MTLIKPTDRRTRKRLILYWFECPECFNGVLREKYKGLNERRCGICRYRNCANKKHGLSTTSEYKSWSMMRARCLNSNYDGYLEYGGRGITICDQWKNSFETFLADMGPRPEDTSLDRIDPNGNYEPANCRWADASVQSSNRRPRGKSGVRGVEKNGSGWCARILFKGVRCYLGQFKTIEEAKEAYLKASENLYASSIS